MLTPADMPPGYVLVISRPDEVDIQDAQDSELAMSAYLRPNGELVFDIRTESSVTGRRNVVRGKELFRLMIQHYGSSIQTIHCYWNDESTNLAEFNRFTTLGMSEEEAASKVWSGARAIEHGFVKVTMGERIKAGPGAYAIVGADFSR